MITYFTRHPTAANLMMFALIVAGAVVLSGVKRESMPDVTTPEVEVRVVYPGATAADVEEAICQRIEDAVDGVRFVEEVRSDAREGVAVVTVEMTEGGDMLTFRNDVKSEVDAIDDFPEDAEEPVVKQLGTTQVVMSILVTGPMPLRDLKAYCEDLKTRLQELPDVSLVEIQGFSDHQLQVRLRAEALMRYGLSTGDVARVIGSQSVDMPAGDIETPDGDVVLRVTELRRTPDELLDLVVTSGVTGAEIRVADIGEVVDVFEKESDKVVLDGQRAAKLRISKNKIEDSIRIADSVRAFVDDERVRQPLLDLRITGDESKGLRNQIDLVVTNGWQGMVLVFFTMWLFFNLRLSFWVVMGLPVSFLGASVFMPGFDLTINFMTLIGFLLAIGLLMDDSIVIAENISAKYKPGMPGWKAAIEGVSEVKFGVISSFLTTTFILGPLTVISGDTGKQLAVVPMILILVMGVSLLEAFGILPAHLSHTFGHGDEPNAFRRAFDRFMAVLTEGVGRVVDVAVRFRYAFLGLLIAALILSMGFLVSGKLPFQAMPELEGDVIVARILMPQGTPLEQTEKTVDRVLAGLAAMDEEYSAKQGGDRRLVENAYVEFGKNADAFESGPHLATIIVDLLTAEERTGRVDDYLATWRKEIGDLPDLISLVLAEPAVGSSGRPIDVRIGGRDLGMMKDAAVEIREFFDGYEGVNNVLDDLRPGKPERRIRLRDGANVIGVDAETMARQLGASFRGSTADEVQVGAESYEIDVRHRPVDRDGFEDLAYFHVSLPDGKQVPLTAVAEIEEGRGWGRIARIDGRRTVTVRGDVDSKVTNTAELFRAFENEFLPGFSERYPDLALTTEGETKESGKTGASMIQSLIIGLVGVFILLSFQFKSYIEPLMVMIAIPLALIGVVAGHMLLGVPFTLPGLLGYISLAGIVVNDSILLVEFIKIARRRGEDPLAAATGASRARFRAVLLTSITTIAGLLPLLAEKSLSAQIIQPLAISIAFGLMASTVLVLVALPAFYTVLDDFGLTADVSDDGM